MVFVGFAAGAQVQDESQTPGQESETSYEYEQETNTDGSVESETDYYSETEIDNQETETEFNSETESESSWSQNNPVKPKIGLMNKAITRVVNIWGLRNRVELKSNQNVCQMKLLNP